MTVLAITHLFIFQIIVQMSEKFLWQTLTLFEGMVDVEQRQVVSINVSKPHLGLVSRLLSLRGADKTLWD